MGKSNYIYTASLVSLYILTGVFHVHARKTQADELPIRVTGTISFGAQRNAIVELQSGQGEEVFQEGNTIPGGYVIKRIMKDRLILEKGGVTTVLPFLNGGTNIEGTTMMAQPNLSQPTWFQDQIPPADNSLNEETPANVIDYLMPRS
jgi:type II secretory pathway component PulC